ncbi:MAG: hypothetical protein Q4D95_04130 [Peptoniphilus sp.]|nr:hypothetical protein [Peptoniphilus sp.]
MNTKTKIEMTKEQKPQKKNYKLYNIIFPIWFLIALPPIWLVTIPANFIIDSLVVFLGMKKLKIQKIKETYLKSIIKVVFFGFLSDILSGIALFIISMIVPDNFQGNIFDGVFYKPTKSIYSFAVVALTILFAAVMIYFFNKKFSFTKTDLTKEQVHKLSLYLSIFTAPYFFLVSLDFMDKIFNIY